MENKTPDKEKMLALLALLSPEDRKRFGERVYDGFRETLEAMKPQVDGHNCFYMVGVVVALRQLADNITESMERLGVPLFPEMIGVFGKELGFEAVAFTKPVKEDSEWQI